MEFAEFFDGHVFVNEKGNYIDFLKRLIRHIYFLAKFSIIIAIAFDP